MCAPTQDLICCKMDMMKCSFSLPSYLAFFLSEFFATFGLVFYGCMGCVVSEKFSNHHLQLCLNFGLVIMIFVQSFGHISGAHMNPSVTLCAVFLQLKTPLEGLIYFVGQMLGASLGYGLILALVPSNVVKMPGNEVALCVTRPSVEISRVQANLIEIFITTALILVCCSIWDPRNAKNTDGISIKLGLTIACCAITGGQFTGASMNPARSFAPAVWHLDFTDHWIYWFGPITGSCLASTIYITFFLKPFRDSKQTAWNDD